MRAVYYRIYMEDGAILSLCPVYKNDPYLGCILATSIAPPHNTAKIKRYLCNIEKIDHSSASSLFITASEQAPVNDDVGIDLLADPGPGSGPYHPIALVIESPVAEYTSRKFSKLKALGQPTGLLVPRFRMYCNFTPSLSVNVMRAVYYRIYAEDKAILSLRPLYKSDPYLGCVPATSVAPPHKTTDIKRYLCKIEKIANPSSSSLYITASEPRSVDDGNHLAILAGGGPGSVPGHPIALVINSPVAEDTSRKCSKLKVLRQPAAPLEPRLRTYHNLTSGR